MKRKEKRLSHHKHILLRTINLIPSLRAPRKTLLPPVDAPGANGGHRAGRAVEVRGTVPDGRRDEAGRQPVEQHVGEVDGARVLRVQRRDELGVFAAWVFGFVSALCFAFLFVFFRLCGVD